MNVIGKEFNHPEDNKETNKPCRFENYTDLEYVFFLNDGVTCTGTSIKRNNLKRRF